MQDTLDYDELRRLINDVHKEAIRAPTYIAVRRAIDIVFRVHGVKLFGMYDLSLWCAKMRPGGLQLAPVAAPATAPQRTIAPPTPARRPLIQLQPVDYDPTLLGYVFKEIYNSHYDFSDCKDPDTLLRFIHPLDGKWDLRHDQLTGQQQKTVTAIGIHYRDWRAAQGYIPGYLIRRNSQTG